MDFIEKFGELDFLEKSLFGVIAILVVAVLFLVIGIVSVPTEVNGVPNSEENYFTAMLQGIQESIPVLSNLEIFNIQPVEEIPEDSPSQETGTTERVTNRGADSRNWATGGGSSGGSSAPAPEIDPDLPPILDPEDPPEEDPEPGPIPVDALITTPPNFKVAFFGDGWLGGDYADVLQMIRDEGADMVIHSGDIVNDDRADYPQRWYDEYMIPIMDTDGTFPYFYAIGNHDDEDWLGTDEHIGYRELQQNRFDDLGLTYTGSAEELGAKTSFSYNGLFVTLTAPGFHWEDPGSEFTGEDHEEFLEEQLRESNHLWQICSWHKLMEEMQIGGKSDEVTWGMYETCREYGALIANGHEHSYARTHILSDMSEQIVDNNVSPYELQPGQTMSWHAGTGGAGMREQKRCPPLGIIFGDPEDDPAIYDFDRDGPLPLHQPGSCNGEWAVIYTEYQNVEHGALFIEFNVAAEGEEETDPRRARAYFKNIDGEVIDEFEIYNNKEFGVVPEPPAPEPYVPTEGNIVTREGDTLYLDEEEFRFVGGNAYGAANDREIYACDPSGYDWDDPDEQLEIMFSQFRANGLNAMRFWAFQGFTRDGTDFRALDRVFSKAAEYGIKVIPVLENQWDHCEGIGDVPGSIYKQSDWYGGGYNTNYNSYAMTFPEYVTAVVSRYQSEPAILMWQIMNEAESRPCPFEDRCEGTDESTANLLNFTTEISELIKSIDGNHLVSLGTMGSGQPGTRGEAFVALHELDSIDIVEAHDYEGPEPMPEDMGEALAVANSLNKPFFIGEAGMEVDADLNHDRRAELFDAKIGAMFEDGGDGYLIWAWENPREGGCSGNCFTQGDPLLEVLRRHS